MTTLTFIVGGLLILALVAAGLALVAAVLLTADGNQPRVGVRGAIALGLVVLACVAGGATLIFDHLNASQSLDTAAPKVWSPMDDQSVPVAEQSARK